MAMRSTLIEAFCLILVWFLVLLLLVGCNRSSEANAPAANTSRAVSDAAQTAQAPPAPKPTRAASDPVKKKVPLAREPGELTSNAPSEFPPASLTTSLRQLRPVDDAQIADQGIRKLAGKHLILYTDVPASAAIDALPSLFDEAVPQWCAYFGIDPERAAHWQVRGSVMTDRPPFEKAGLLPVEIPDFKSGFALNGELWLFDQTSEYYRRHLLLHEGTHAFMTEFLGVGGPPWYVEGLAELLATHAIDEGKLKLNHFPRSRDEVPGLGRIGIVQEGFASRQAMLLPRILLYDSRAHLQLEPYGWCWAAAAFLDGHPRYQKRFRQLIGLGDAPDFNQQFLQRFADDWSELNEEWQLFVATLEHNHSLARTAVDFTPGEPLKSDRAAVTIAADRGWQNTGLRLEAGVTYELGATGRYEVAQSPRPWICEPGGVTLRYYQGRPLGILLAAIRPDTPEQGVSPLLKPATIGTQATLTPPASGTLFLRINDSAGELDDNAGQLKVTVTRR